MTYFINPKLTDRQISIIKGTVLGGSSIVCPKGGKNCYLSMRSRNEKWLHFKAAELNSLCSHNPITIEKTNRWHSLCYPVFTNMREDFYSNEGRCLTFKKMDHLNLKDIAFAIWYGDAGSYKNNSIILNTHIWGEKGSKAIVKYFSLLNYKSEIIQERKNFRVKLCPDSTKNFATMISPLLPAFFHSPPNK